MTLSPGRSLKERQADILNKHIQELIEIRDNLDPEYKDFPMKDMKEMSSLYSFLDNLTAAFWCVVIFMLALSGLAFLICSLG